MRRHADILDAIILNDFNLIKPYMKDRVYLLPYLLSCIGIGLLFVSMKLFKKGR